LSHLLSLCVVGEIAQGEKDALTASAFKALLQLDGGQGLSKVLECLEEGGGDREREMRSKVAASSLKKLVSYHLPRSKSVALLSRLLQPDSITSYGVSAVKTAIFCASKLLPWERGGGELILSLAAHWGLLQKDIKSALLEALWEGLEANQEAVGVTPGSLGEFSKRGWDTLLAISSQCCNPTSSPPSVVLTPAQLSSAVLSRKSLIQSLIDLPRGSTQISNAFYSLHILLPLLSALLSPVSGDGSLDKEILYKAVERTKLCWEPQDDGAEGFISTALEKIILAGLCSAPGKTDTDGTVKETHTFDAARCASEALGLAAKKAISAGSKSDDPILRTLESVMQTLTARVNLNPTSNGSWEEGYFMQLRAYKFAVYLTENLLSPLTSLRQPSWDASPALPPSELAVRNLNSLHPSLVSLSRLLTPSNPLLAPIHVRLVLSSLHKLPRWCLSYPASLRKDAVCASVPEALSCLQKVDPFAWKFSRAVAEARGAIRCISEVLPEIGEGLGSVLISRDLKSAIPLGAAGLMTVDAIVAAASTWKRQEKLEEFLRMQAALVQIFTESRGVEEDGLRIMEEAMVACFSL